MIDKKNITTYEEFMAPKYGPEGSPSRLAFESRAQSYFLCEMLKEERRRLGFTQQQMADRLGMKKSFLSRIENGKSDIQLSTLMKVLDGLGLQIQFVPVAVAA